jgi:glycine/D-amino acid oxidase-like deaminating enzyme
VIPTKSFDFCLFGAGLAGIHLALELVKTGARICIIDPNGIGSGASGAPVGLANPATGRYAKKSWKAEHCVTALKRNLDLIQGHTSIPFFRASGVLRPAIDHDIAIKMKQHYDSTLWPPGWVEWLDETAVKRLHPGIKCVHGGLWVKAGITVNMYEYVKAASSYLANKSVKFITHQEYTLSHNSPWYISTTTTKLTADNIVFTSGFWTKEVDFWKNLPMVPVKGQTLLMEAEQPLPFKHAVSALGYIGSISKNKYVLGSTYEHHFDHTETDQAAIDYLLKRSEEVIPGLNQQSKIIHQWASIRASTPNRIPILGEHPTHNKCYIFAGMGSKGLLYSAYLAEQMAGFLIHANLLPGEVRVERFKAFQK